MLTSKLGAEMGCLFGTGRRYLFWIWLLLSIGLLVNGCEEAKIAFRCAATPERVEVTELEAGFRPGTDYVTLGPHLALFEGSVYEMMVEKGHEKDPPSDSTAISKLYYPVLSSDHPLAQGQDPAKSAWFKVLISTKRFKTLGEVRRAQGDRDAPLPEPPLTGVVINQIDPLTEDDRKLLREGFPLLSLDAVTIVEEGRVPTSRAGAVALLLLGVLVFAGPLLGYALLWRRRQAHAPVPAATSMPLPPPRPGQSVPWPAATPTYASAPPASAGPGPAYGSMPPGGSVPPGGSRPAASGSMAPASLRAGARVCVTRNETRHFGSVLKTQLGQVYVSLDDGRKVWVAEELVSLA